MTLAAFLQFRRGRLAAIGVFVRNLEISILAALTSGNDEIAFVKVPRARQGNWPRAASDADVDSMLDTAVALADVEARSPFRAITIGEAAMGLGGALLLLPFGVTALRRRRNAA